MRKHTGERPFGCSQCPKRFTRKTLAKSHLVKGHIMESEETSFLCPVCNISCGSEKALARHISTYDIAGSSFQCNECKHHLKCAVSLNRHMKWHHPTKPSKCNSCNFVSKTIRGLRNHKRKSHPKELKQEKATYWMGCLVTSKLSTSTEEKKSSSYLFFFYYYSLRWSATIISNAAHKALKNTLC